MPRVILHVDMDAFFASVAVLDDPSLRGKPVLVGGGERRGVVAAASYEARRYGCHSAMPMARARRLCPDAIVVSPKRGRYEEVSAAVFAIFRRFTPLVEGLSVDEAFLDVGGSRGLFGDGEAIARAIRAAIRAEVGLTASAGVAPSKFVAKIASDLDKPDGLVVVDPAHVPEFLAPLALDKMWGVGPKAAARLRAMGHETVGDLAAASPDALEQALGSWGRAVWELAQGMDERPVVAAQDAKSVGAEETYDEDLTTRREIEATLLAHASRVAARLHDGGLRAGCVTVKIKYSDFTTKTRQLRLRRAAADAATLYEAAVELLERFPLSGRRVRLTGLSASALDDQPPAPSLFEDGERTRREAVEGAMAKVRARFGDGGLTRAALLDAPGRRPEARELPARLPAPVVDDDA